MKTRALSVLICLFALAASASAQKGYTDPKHFALDIEMLAAQYPMDFDSQASGSSAALYGITHISAAGLDGDGSTPLDLEPIAMDKFPTVTVPNAMGVSIPDYQFLAGNGDKINFAFDYEVTAFGLFLIGNPSPTGDPPIPFWKMCLSTGFETLSATDPLDTLDQGSDLYFLGVISDQPFKSAELYSDNDPAALFSFNVDSVLWASWAVETGVAGAKTLPVGTGVVLADVMVTRVHSDRFNVETADRTFGIAVMGAGTARDRMVRIFGRTAMTTPDDERVLQLVQILSSTPSAAPRPLGMRTTALGGGAPLGAQVGCTGSFGPNNIGLDAKIWGTVTAIDPGLGWMTVDDGTRRASGVGTSGAMVVGCIDAGSRKVGDMVAVSGSISLFESGTEHYPLMRVADTADIVTLLPAP